ncbi:ATPase [Bacilli bacterium]|nr:ATPase [Bacilli bacterium]
MITGIRKSGKSTILKQYIDFINNTEKANIIIFDYNDLTTKYTYNNIVVLDKYIKTKLSKTKTNYIFFDEIQELDNFQILINSLSLNPLNDIYITGSNAKLLSSEISTLLTGKNIKISVYPLSFKEIYENANIHSLTKEDLFINYMQIGGMPGVLDYENKTTEAKQYLNMVFSDILEHDIFNRHTISDVQIFKNIFYYLQENIGGNIVVDNIRKYLLSNYKIKITNQSISNYITWLVDSFLVYRISKKEIKGKEILANSSKIYSIDLGIRNATINQFSNRGRMLENIVFIELCRRGYEVYVGKDKYINEIDFICIKQNEIMYIQVTEAISKTNYEREIKQLEKINDSNKKIVLSLDKIQDKTESGIYCLNLID